MAKRVSAARLVAYDVLRDVEDRDAYANLMLPSKIRAARLNQQDAGLATELTAGTLRLQGLYDAIIAHAAKRPAEKIDARTLRVLRLGVHQLLSMRVATHAAIYETVEVQRLVANKKATGFVNGVLRTVSRQSIAEWRTVVTEELASATVKMAVAESHPQWVVRALADALKSDGRAEELADLLAADNTSPRVNIVFLPGPEQSLTAVIERAQAVLGDKISFTGVSPIGAEIAGLSPAQALTELAAAGVTARVQDQGSQLAALALLRAKPVAEKEAWLDLCAGPGGKTAVLANAAVAERAAGKEITLRANEVSEHRSRLVREAVADNSEPVSFVTADGRSDTAYGSPDTKYDRILLDAPCSGLGALRRRPEARWRKQPSDIPELVQLQEQLLEKAYAHLAPNGVIAYVTCSPHLAETKGVVERFLRNHDAAAALDVTAQLGLQELQTLRSEKYPTQRALQLWPHAHGSDAMFIALIMRQSTTEQELGN
ncbi:RsmB/NOP family class I SAM-dependent RNA methyltransferase [Canibacter zhoujuaniae]|uniref:RsmB/NOP family class I SAM-dependent RNA methyltransferase n=1 Tax=Canibacter zhoujuaniae TaxID=2708343 RepID=UPI00141DEEDE|nr:transcription antitermination factor NusB [Canibacter zhoujuaniae]